MMAITPGKPAPHMIQSAQCTLLFARCPLSVFIAGGLLDIVEAGFAQQLLEYSPDALLLVAQDGAISFLNAAAERLFGYPRAQLLGADHSMLLAEASREEFHGVLAGLAKATSPGTPSAGSPFAGPFPARAAAPTARNSRSKSRARWSPPRPEQPTPERPWPSPSAAPQAGTRAPAAPGAPSAATLPAVVLLVQRELHFPEVQRPPLLRRLPSTTTNSRRARSATP